MPVRKVIKDGKVGYQYGDQKVFPTKAEAVAQMRAIKANQKSKK